jgi:hypothetical protein
VARASVDHGMVYSGEAREAQSAAWDAFYSALVAILKDEVTPKQAMERAQSQR